MTIPIEVSARHVHLRREDFEALFGKRAKLHKLRDLSQPGTFAAEETVTLKTLKGEFGSVRVVGPLRTYSQVEISRSDACTLGIDPPVRDTHEIEHAGTPRIEIIGPKGSLYLKKGVIVVWRHIHMNHNDALELGLKDGDIVKVDIDNDPRSVVFENVLVRVKPNYKLVMHIDTDEGNAAGIEEKGVGTLIK